MDRPNALSVELLGRAGLYSVNYDRLISPSVALGAGLSIWSVSDSIGGSASIFMLPLYGDFYLNQGSSKGFLTAGLDIGVISDSNISGITGVGFTGSGVGAVLGGGYEYRGDSGFLFRVAPYIIIGSAVDVWFGVSFGGAF